MTTNLDTAVAKLRASTESLNNITDNIADVVRQVEDFLNDACSAGVHAWVTVSEQMDERTGHSSYQGLEYRRVGQRFRIAVTWGWDADPENEDVKAWAECTRDVKLDTAKKLPELVIEIAKKIDSRVTEAEQTTAAVSTVLRALKREEG